MESPRLTLSTYFGRKLAVPVGAATSERVAPLPLIQEASAGGDGRAQASGAAWFPADHLFDASVDASRARALLAAGDQQVRLVDDLLAACAAGAATLPPSLMQALQVSAVALAAAHAGSQLPT